MTDEEFQTALGSLVYPACSVCGSSSAFLFCFYCILCNQATCSKCMEEPRYSAVCRACQEEADGGP